MLPHSITRWTLTFLLLSAEHVLGKTLVPIRPSGGRHTKRQQPSGMDLKSHETFLWGDPDVSDAAVANLTLYMPGDQENVVSMENFDGMLTDVKCTNDSISMTFEDDASFSYAQEVWDWVNGADNHSFVMVAGVGDCGNNTRRMPFMVSSIQYDEVANKATLAASQSNWEAIAHSYDLVVGSVGEIPSNSTNSTNLTESTRFRKRDIEDSTSIDFNHDLPFTFALGVGALEAKILCTNCSTSGQFDIQFKISQKLFVPTGASMTLKPKDISAIAQIKLAGSGSITDSLVKTFDIISIPISALNIPGVLEFGPFLTVAVGAELSAISLTAGVQSGATAKLSNDAILEMDLLNPEENKFSGWEPTVDIIDVTVDASISGGVAVFLQPSVEIKAEALGKGFEIGLNMRIPNINARLAAIASPTGACPNPPPDEPKKTLGVNIGTNIGAQLNIQALKSGESDPLFTVQLATIDKPIAQKCFPFGPEVAARSIAHPHERRAIAAL